MLQDVGMALGNDPQSHACVLDFLKVLPEEVTEGRKITLSVRGTRENTDLIHFGSDAAHRPRPIFAQTDV